MRKLLTALTALAALFVAYYPTSIAKDEKRRLNKFAVECRAYTTHLPAGAYMDLDKEELERLLLGVKYIAENSWFAANRKDAQKLVDAYYLRFPASSSPTIVAA